MPFRVSTRSGAPHYIVNVKVSPHTRDELKLLAQRHQLSMKALTRQMIEHCLADLNADPVGGEHG
jgi:hypothetical protein